MNPDGTARRMVIPVEFETIRETARRALGRIRPADDRRLTAFST